MQRIKTFVHPMSPLYKRGWPKPSPSHPTRLIAFWATVLSTCFPLMERLVYLKKCTGCSNQVADSSWTMYVIAQLVNGSVLFLKTSTDHSQAYTPGWYTERLSGLCRLYLWCYTNWPVQGSDYRCWFAWWLSWTCVSIVRWWTYLI